MQFPIGAMSSGEVLDRGLRILLLRLPALYTINLIVISPVFLLKIVYPLWLYEHDNALSDNSTYWSEVGFNLLMELLAITLQPLATGAILFIVMQQCYGKRVSMAQSFGFALSRSGSLVGASLLVGLIVGLGSIAFLVPGIYLYVIYTFVPHAVLLDEKGVGGALQRSSGLATNQLGRMFLVLLIILITFLTVSYSIKYGLKDLLPTESQIPTMNSFFGSISRVNLYNYLIVKTLVLLCENLFYTYLAICITLLYFDIRFRKEGFDLIIAAELEDEEENPEDEEVFEPRARSMKRGRRSTQA
jgi:hypothetical protein